MKDAIESMRAAMAFDPRDWLINSGDAWLYGIVCGWGNALGEVAALHKWDAAAIARLRRYQLAVARVVPTRKGA